MAPGKSRALVCCCVTPVSITDESRLFQALCSYFTPTFLPALLVLIISIRLKPNKELPARGADAKRRVRGQPMQSKRMPRSLFSSAETQDKSKILTYGIQNQ